MRAMYSWLRMVDCQLILHYTAIYRGVNTQFIEKKKGRIKFFGGEETRKKCPFRHIFTAIQLAPGNQPSALEKLPALKHLTPRLFGLEACLAISNLSR